MRSIGDVEIGSFDPDEIANNPVYMPDAKAAEAAVALVEKVRSEKDSVGGVVECVIKNVPTGLGEPVFDKLDARLAQAVFSIGAVKGFEVGEGFAAARLRGSENNDAFRMAGDRVTKVTNHAGGILGGISDGDDIIFRAAFKPTPSIAQTQQTVNRDHEDTDIEIHGRHDPVIAPRAVVVVESMAAIVIADMYLSSLGNKLDDLK